MKITQLLPTSSELEITLPTGEQTGIKLRVVGQDSQQFRTAAKSVAQVILNRKDGNSNVDDLEDKNTRLIAACVVGWSGLENEDGMPLPYSPEKSLEIFSMPELTFMREQVEGFVAKRHNFFRRSTKQSGTTSPTVS